jgi:hypothetical protein
MHAAPVDKCCIFFNISIITTKLEKDCQPYSSRGLKVICHWTLNVDGIVLRHGDLHV